MTSGIASISGICHSLSSSISRRHRKTVAVASASAGLTKVAGEQAAASNSAQPTNLRFGYEAAPCFALDGVDFFETITLERHAVPVSGQSLAEPATSSSASSASRSFIDWLLPSSLSGRHAYSLSPSWSFDGLDLDLVSVPSVSESTSNHIPAPSARPKEEVHPMQWAFDGVDFDLVPAVKPTATS